MGKIASALSLFVTSALLLTTSGCAAPNTGSGSLQVAATTTQLQDFVQQIGKDKVTVTGLLKPGASAHSFDPSPADLKALASAKILIVNGAGLDDFVHNALEAAGFNGKIVTAAAEIDLAEAAHITAEARQNSTNTANPHAAHSHAEDTTSKHSHGSEHDHEANTSSYDPHIWTSLKFAQQMLNPITQALSAADPANAAYFEANAAAYAAQLKALDSWLGEQFAQVSAEKKKFVSTHNALLYFLHDYDIKFVGSIIPSFEDNAEPSAAEIAQLVAGIKTQKVPAVFLESSSSPRLNNMVAQEAGVPVITEPIYADSLAASGAASNYLGATLANARTMLNAWGYSTEVPAQLQQTLQLEQNNE